METHYTLNFLIKYLYGETSVFKRLEIENALEEDSYLKKEYNELKKGFDNLPKVQFYPTDNTMNAILNYSNRGALNPSF